MIKSYLLVQWKNIFQLTLLLSEILKGGSTETPLDFLAVLRGLQLLLNATFTGMPLLNLT